MATWNSIGGPIEIGTPGSDFIALNELGVFRIKGLGGDDTLVGDDNETGVMAGDDNDLVFGQGGDDWLSGQNGIDALLG
ncbi:MAG TPA: hypothetical protein VKA18_11110, partial [Alphaproteobacteria bacterium]|nr:hypothetical protein [Alphaproteobacteria bacterium]